MRQENQVFYEGDIKQIDKLLAKLITEAEAKCALLVDKDGRMVTRQGFTNTIDTTALGALLAGSFASTKEIARLVGEPEFTVLFHQGKKDHIHINIVGERHILVVIFDDRTTIGMVRLYAKEVTAKFLEIFEHPAQEQVQDKVDREFTSLAENKLNDIFKD
ncbi:MAG: dynein regulation protein LC7 [candidate division Zixibacteria bacterium CG_4_9_14_3_um_filter_46_8]|nr:MAG: dynein regulation protein LC7 [candidate division Zixibacteria bacterium CG_4_9_14_3_um_filter_46_8]